MATMANLERERHNKFIVEILCEFMKANDCGASAGRMTCPAPPPDCAKERLEEIKKLTSDKIGTTRKAISYLAAHELYCERDYEFDAAFDRANDFAFQDTINTRIAAGRGRVRVRLEGWRPAWWDGHSFRDESGHPVKWARGKGHTFLTPEIYVEAAQDMELVPSTPGNFFWASENAPAAKVEEEEESVNPFDQTFPPTAPVLKPLLITPPVPELNITS
jgi:hypothetical protein